MSNIPLVHRYLKVAKAMTGFHQENENASAVNINCGGDSSTWTAVTGDNIQKAFDLIK